MSFKPVDFQIMIPRTSEVSKIHNDAQSKNSALQQQLSSAAQNRAESGMRQVNSRDGAQQALIKERQSQGRQKQDEGEHSRRNGREKKVQEKRTDPPIQTSTIDIKI